MPFVAEGSTPVVKNTEEAYERDELGAVRRRSCVARRPRTFRLDDRIVAAPLSVLWR